MEIKPEDELSNIVLFPAKEDDPRNQVNFLYEPSERPYCHHASVRVDEKERQVLDWPPESPDNQYHLNK
ncbi:hypothetical protein [Escherichia coli]